MELDKNNSWKYNQNFSLLNLINETHINEYAESSLFHGTLIEHNYWENVKLDNSDFEALRIIGSTIKNSSLKCSDIHSLLVSHTIFDTVSFQESDISDCTFTDCEFINCDFSQAALKENQFNNCLFDTPLFKKGSYIMNNFIDSTLVNTSLKNVFYYTYYKNCTFQYVQMEAYLLGYSYGLTVSNLEELSFLFMGNICNDNYQKICNDICNVYIERGMDVNRGILYLIDPQMPIEKAIIKCFDCVYSFIKQNYLVLKEQLEFLNKIVNILYTEQNISTLAIICLINIVNKTLNMSKNSALKKAEQGLLSVKNSMLTAYYHFMDELQEHLSELPQEGDWELEVVYEKKPAYRLTDIIKDIDPDKEITVVKTATGSFIEVLKMASDILPYIDTFLAFLGLAFTIVGTYKNSNTEEKSECSIVQITNNITFDELTPQNLKLLSEVTQKSMDPVLQKNINKTITFIINNNFIHTDDYYGYNKKNVRSIKAKKHSKKK